MMEMGTSTPEPSLGLSLSCFEKHSSCCVVFMPGLGYCTVSGPSGATSSWKSCTIPVYQHWILVAAPWLGSVDSPQMCWAVAALQQTVKLQTSPFSSSSVPPGGARSGCSVAQELLSFPGAGAAEHRLEPHTHSSCLDLEEQSSRKMCHYRQKELQRKADN